MQLESYFPLTDHLCCVTIVTKNFTYGKLFWFLIVFTWWTFLDHCQQNWSIFTCLTPVESKTWTLTISSITFKQYSIDGSNWILTTRGICWYGFWQHLSNFLIWCLYKLSCDPRFPVQDVTWQKYEILILGPMAHTSIIKSSNPLYNLFSCINLASFQSKEPWCL